jgi:heterodisulfide reductase subunit B
MCQSNLDMRRPHIDRYLKTKTTIPVMYITQAIGLAVGLSRKELGLAKLFVKAVEPVVVN